MRRFKKTKMLNGFQSCSSLVIEYIILACGSILLFNIEEVTAFRCPFANCSVATVEVCRYLIWHLVRYIYAPVGWVIIGSGNDLAPNRRQVITWTNEDQWSNGPLEIYFSEIWIKNTQNSLKKRIWKYRLHDGSHFNPASICYASPSVSEADKAVNVASLLPSLRAHSRGWFLLDIWQGVFTSHCWWRLFNTWTASRFRGQF